MGSSGTSTVRSVIEATWLGGPHDGDTWPLSGPAWFALEFLDEECYDASGQRESLTFHSRWFKPELLSDGRYVIVWRES